MAKDGLTIPDISTLDPEQVVVRYDEPSDTLFVHFYGAGMPGVTAQLDDFVFLRLDETEQSVIGLQIEAFLNAATVARPELLSLAQLANTPPDMIQHWLERNDTRHARLSAIHAAIHDLAVERDLER